MIIEPLTRILQRLDAKTTKMVEKWTDPIMLTMGMAAWLGRVYRIQSEGDDDNRRGRVEPSPEPISPDGRAIEIPVNGSGDDSAFFHDPIVSEIGGDRIELGL